MRFFQMPKILVEEPKYAWLSAEAIFLYTLLLDLMQLSKKNCWRDPVGVYIYYSQARMAEVLHRSLPTVRKRLAELVEAGLLVRKRRGLTHCDKLYVIPATLFPSGEENDSVSAKQDSLLPDGTDVSPNDTNPSAADTDTKDTPLLPKKAPKSFKTAYDEIHYPGFTAEQLAEIDAHAADCKRRILARIAASAAAS